MTPHKLFFMMSALFNPRFLHPWPDPHPRVVVVTQEVAVTHQVETPTPAVLVATPPRRPPNPLHSRPRPPQPAPTIGPTTAGSASAPITFRPALRSTRT